MWVEVVAKGTETYSLKSTGTEAPSVLLLLRRNMSNQSLNFLTLENRKIKWLGLAILFEKKEGPILKD